MSSFRALDRRTVGFVLLFCAYAVNLTAWGIQTGRSLQETTAADVAISVPRTLATCPHHPHGCPKDCLCPKTYITVHGGDADDEDSGALRGTALVTCTGQGSPSLNPSFAAFLPVTCGEIRAFATTIYRVSEEKSPRPHSFAEPPQKVPIV